MSGIIIGGGGAAGPQGEPGIDGANGADGAPGDATAYTPAVGADWSDDPPATIAEALDRLAAAMGPIP